VNNLGTQWRHCLPAEYRFQKELQNDTFCNRAQS